MCHHDISALNNPHIKPLVLFLHRGFAGRGWQLCLLEDRKGRGQALSLWGPEAVTPEAPSHETHHTQGLNAIGHLSQGSSSLQLSGTGSHDWLGGHKRVGRSQAWEKRRCQQVRAQKLSFCMGALPSDQATLPVCASGEGRVCRYPPKPLPSPRRPLVTVPMAKQGSTYSRWLWRAAGPRCWARPRPAH